MSLTPENLDKVMTELVAVSRSAMSKREEAVNLARIWGKAEGASRRVAREPGADEFAALATSSPVRRRVRWRRVA